MKKVELQSILGKYCKEYREQHLNLTLSELSEDSGVHYKTLYSFENGQSSNLYIFYLYFNRADSFNHFTDGLKEVLNNE